MQFKNCLVYQFLLQVRLKEKREAPFQGYLVLSALITSLLSSDRKRRTGFWNGRIRNTSRIELKKPKECLSANRVHSANIQGIGLETSPLFVETFENSANSQLTKCVFRKLLYRLCRALIILNLQNFSFIFSLPYKNETSAKA